MALSPAKIFGRPTADRIWMGPAQRRALAFLEDSIPGVVKVVLGPRSCGKSIVLDRYLSGVEDKIYFRSRDGWQNPTELLEALLASADLTPVNGTGDDRREQFRCYLNEERELGNDLLIVIDGAEQLTSSIWLEFYRISTLMCEDGYTPELLISGQPQAYEYLKSPLAHDWNTMNFAVHRVPPLEPLDVCVFIKERLNSVGLPDAVFSPPARVLMGKLAGGSFVTTNLLCQMSLVLARQRGSTFVDEELVHSAYAQLGKGQIQAAAREMTSCSETSESGELFVSQGSRLIARYDLEERLLLGRGEHNQVLLDSPEVSRHHAAIFNDGDGYYVEDLGSVNGMTVNGELCNKRRLADRDVVTIGPYQLTFAAPMYEEDAEPVRHEPLRAVEDPLPSWAESPELA